MVNKTIYLCKAYNSYTNKNIFRVFDTIKEADQFCIGLTNHKIYGFRGKNKNDAFNKALTSVVQGEHE